MYTFNMFVYGHDLSVNKELNNKVWEYDLMISKNINGLTFESEAPYHGGQVRGDTYSVVFGHVITCDDANPNFINEVRDAKEEDYYDAYQEFLQAFIKECEQDMGSDESEETENYNKFVTELKEFFKTNLPGFYSVEASS